MSPTNNRPRGRHDATRIQLPDDFNAIFPYVMRGRNESIVFYPILIDAENLLSHIERSKGTDNEITIFQAIMLALVRVLRERPSLNRYVAGRRLYQRENVVLSFLAKRKYADDGQETNVLVTVKPDDDRRTIIGKLTGEIRAAKSGAEKADDKVISQYLHLPRCLLRAAVKAFETWEFFVDTPKFLRGVDPLHCSVFVANVGSIGLGAMYHHLYEWGNCSLFVAIGKIEPQVCVGEDGKPAVHRMLQLRVSLDERIADGYYDARSLDLFRDYLTDLTWMDNSGPVSE